MKATLLSFIVALSSFVTHAQTNPDLPNPEILSEKYLEQISKREAGQTRFAVSMRAYPRTQSAPGGARGASTSDGNREVQESDVYKPGRKGNKELFLLNRYRGFQVVSFVEGLDQPKLVGRFPVYNNWNSEMYYLESQEKVIVLNTEWSYSLNRWNTNYQTVLYMLDVSDSAQPKLMKELRLSGYLQESRMVGDVLYAITHDGNWNETKASITSVKISNNSLQAIESQELNADSRWVRTMNVVKEGEKYFVISTLSNWQNQGDLVNIHDITSDAGKIEKFMTVKARGTIAERSQTFFHKNHFFAVSNYRENNNARMRVSVEAFPVVKSDTTITSAANMRLSVGDTNGQHASLQDVRVSGDMLYTFWVPANNIDPFDLFDISEPAKGLKHLGQLQFEGWIAKAFPIDHQNRKFVLGLGWIVPATSETNRRYPQAKLFEITKTAAGVKHEVVASLTLDNQEVYASLNNLDKYFEVIQETPGVYNILFPVTFSKNWKSGAKLVTADLNQSSLSEGASIAGDQGWLNRVFVNKEVRAINSFSDLALETFDQKDIVSNQIAKTVSILELARNIVDFQVLNPTTGMQVVSQDKQVELRLVNLEKADAEKSDVLSRLILKGKYQWHRVLSNKLFVITSHHRTTQRTSNGYSWNEEVFDRADIHAVELDSLNVSSVDLGITRDQNQSYYSFEVKSTKLGTSEFLTIGADIFKLSELGLEKIQIQEACQYFFKNETHELSLQSVSDELYVYNSFHVKPSSLIAQPPHYGTTYSLPFMKKLTLEGKTLNCSPSINVPGRPAMVRGNFLVSSDVQRMYYRGIPYSYAGHGGFYPRMGASRTFSLKFNSEREVELIDVLSRDITSGYFADGFATYSAAEGRLDIWTLSAEGELISKPHYLNYLASKDSSLITIRTFHGHNFLFMKNEKKVDVYELSKGRKLNQLDVSSSFDQNLTDKSAEYVFGMSEISASDDLNTFYISQGLYGLTEILVK